MSLDKVTLFKIKSTAQDFADFIRVQDSKKVALPALRMVGLPELQIEANVEVRATFRPTGGAIKTQDDVPWLKFLNEGLPTEAKFEFWAQNRQPSGIAAIKIARPDRTAFYALTFGLGGESFLDSASIVRDFGIRVAMNICDAEHLRRIQTSIHEAISTQAEKQISTGSPLSVFGIDEQKEFLRSVSGAANDAFPYIRSFTGRESISIKVDRDDKLDWGNIVERVDAIGLAYDGDQYQTTFTGYDKFHLETDKDLLAQLDSQIFAAITANQLDHIHLAPPEFMDFDSFEFSYHAEEDAPRFDDIVLADLLASRKRAFGTKSSIQSLHNMRVYLWSTDSGVQVKSWPAYRCIVAEADLAGATYILSMGQWKRVSDNLKTEVDSYVAAIPVANDPFLIEGVHIWEPQARKDAAGNDKGENRESVYNDAVAVAGPLEIFLFDKAKVQIARERQYEICDLLHTSKCMVQVKRLKSGAASITHLFLQGRFYGDAFLSDEKCRESMQDHINANANGRDVSSFVQIVPLNRGELISNEYRIIFCLLCDAIGKTVDDLPFMARYELMYSHRHLHNALGFRCEIAFRQVVLGP